MAVKVCVPSNSVVLPLVVTTAEVDRGSRPSRWQRRRRRPSPGRRTVTPETRNCSSFDADELFAEVTVVVPWPDCGWNAIEVGAAGVSEAHGLATAPVAVSATTFTVKVWVVGVFVPSEAVTVTV